MDFPLLQRLALPVTIGSARYPGVKIHDTRIIRLLEVLLHGGNTVGGWTARQIHEAVLPTFQLSPKTYRLNQLRYDLRKLKGHGLLEREASHYAYRLTDKGLQAALLSLYFHKRLCGPQANSQFHHKPDPAWVADTGKPITNGNPSVEPGYLDDPTKFSTLRSALAAPLHDATGVIGVTALYSLERDAFTKDHLRVLLAVNPKVSLSIENALKYQRVTISSTTDALTSLPNTRSLFLHLDTELARSRRDNKPLAVLVCDLDGFKQINDRFGHLEGNRILKLVSAGMRECCREYDYVARMGGDEFVLIMPGVESRDIPGKVALWKA